MIDEKEIFSLVNAERALSRQTSDFEAPLGIFCQYEHAAGRINVYLVFHCVLNTLHELIPPTIIPHALLFFHGVQFLVSGVEIYPCLALNIVICNLFFITYDDIFKGRIISLLRKETSRYG